MQPECEHDWPIDAQEPCSWCLQAALAAKDAEIARLTALLEEWKQSSLDQEGDKEEAWERITELEVALRRHGEHGDACLDGMAFGHPCACGLERALRGKGE